MSKIKSLEQIKVRVINTEKLKELFAIEVPTNQRLNIKKECLYESAFMIGRAEITSYIARLKALLTW